MQYNNSKKHTTSTYPHVHLMCSSLTTASKLVSKQQESNKLVKIINYVWIDGIKTKQTDKY